MRKQTSKTFTEKKQTTKEMNKLSNKKQTTTTKNKKASKQDNK